MGRELVKLAPDATASKQTFAQFLLQLIELELATHAANWVTMRIRDAGFPVEKDFNTDDISAIPQLPKPKILELTRCEWITQKSNCCFVGSNGTGKSNLIQAIGARSCVLRYRVR